MTERSHAALIAAAMSISLCAQILVAVDCSVPDNRYGTSLGNVFTLTVGGFSDSEVQTAINYWSGCPGYGGEIPSFRIGGSGGVPVTVVKVNGNSTSSDGSCGEVRLGQVNGRIESATITVWTRESDGDPCLVTDSLAHEFGHLLGLADTRDLACAGHIMGFPFEGMPRTVRSDDCAVADDKWETTEESQPPPDPYCDAYCWTSCVNNVCPDGNPWCPILVDTENDGIHLTGLDDPVWFDIDANGAADLMAWTDRGEGLLALDRNGNGTVDSGAELFGNATPLLDGTRALNGYEALAELDAWVLGGNGDGVIDPADDAFGSLWMWTDRNHDGVSQPEELRSLAEAGIRRMDLDYKRSHRTDRYGNQFRFLGRAWKTNRHGMERPVLTWDVFFVVVP